MRENKKLSIYIHIPFCIQKCAYCDFLSFPSGEKEQADYVKALKEEIIQKAKKYNKRGIATIFLGGGTPSCIEPNWIVEIMELLQQHYKIEKDAEISIEVNPASGSREKLECYKKAGINRLSIGLQSPNDEILSRLNRAHKYEDFLETYEAAVELGFTNINIDFMSALPGQTLEDYKQGLAVIERLPIMPTHISAYSLIIEEGTPFYKCYVESEEIEKGYELPEEDVEREMYEFTEWYLQSKGYSRYEISNYSQVGKQCKHNVVYWKRGDYLGLGLGASSKVGNQRWKNTANFNQYLEEDFDNYLEEAVTLSKEDEMEEFMFLGLRMMEGIKASDFLNQFGQEIESVYGKQLKKLEKQGLLEIGQHSYLTKKGIDVSNYVFEQFLL